MLFNSKEFLLFLPIVFLIYWFVVNRNLKLQNAFVLLASYVFYGWWDYRFLALIAASTLIDFWVGRQLGKEPDKKQQKALLTISIVFNLGILGFFKYFNFFIESWVEAWGSLGVSMETSSLNIILPVGISFYTFQTLSYTIDVYRKKLTPSNDLINFASYVAFFPQLVAGPIERATRLLPQFSKKRSFSYDQAVSGVSLIIWGLFKKVVIADNCAYFVNLIFESPGSYSASELFLGAVLFAFQIYGDFSGYSDIAIGVARLFGFDLMTNFKFPYFSKNIGDFWRRWHISLSTWFRDYLYIPLGGSRGSKANQVRNIFIIFLVSGFWHGANWTFIAWGGIHALLFLPLLLGNVNRKHLHETHFKWQDILKILVTFVLVTIAWIYFRADSIAAANDYVLRLFATDWNIFSVFTKSPKHTLFTSICIFSIVLMLIQEFIAYRKGYKEVRLNIVTTVFYIIVIILLGAYKNPSEFIYFQF
ncbi:MAG: MBOAT family protein [Flavobacteriales bacterium]|jgi:alginate O-acetyltransferase complex protein AlgI|nr:MBOAT family protein [Flavobacteriales bacterium]